MVISTRGRYALRFLIDLAQNQGDTFVPLRDIAERQEISEKYLEIVVKTLVRGGFLLPHRGKGGGYRLNRAPEEYSIKEIVERTEGTLAPVACLEGAENCCQHRADCPTLPLWQGLDKVISDYLSQYTLADLLPKGTE